MVHEGTFSSSGSVKGDQKVGGILNENHVLPSRKMRWRWCIRERQDSKCRAVDVKRMRRPDCVDLPYFHRSKLGFDIDASQICFQTWWTSRLRPNLTRTTR